MVTLASLARHTHIFEQYLAKRRYSHGSRAWSPTLTSPLAQRYAATTHGQLSFITIPDLLRLNN